MADMNNPTRKKQKSVSTEANIISDFTDLPTQVLYKIVECLPLRDAARTSVLSHRWNHIWTSIPSLVLDDQFFTSVFKQKVHTHRFCNIVSKLLLQHKGPINKFELFVPPVKNTPDFTPWISYLSRNDIRDFSLYNQNNMITDLSSQLYSWVGLEKLKLVTCILIDFPKFRGFTKLTVLQLVDVYIHYNILKYLTGSCPLLEKLELTQCLFMENGDIIIDAPKLRSLVIDSEFSSLKVQNGENLVSATIVAQRRPVYPHNACWNDLMNALESSNKLETLALGGSLCRIFFMQGTRPNIFQQLRNLELSSIVLDDPDDFFSTIYCIRSLSNVERLKISVYTSQTLNDRALDYNPDWTLQHLRCAIFSTYDASNTDLKLIEYLLVCSPELEKLSVTFTRPVSQSLYARMLVQFCHSRRASQKVGVRVEHLTIMPNESGQRDAAETSSSSSSQMNSDYSSSDDNSNSETSETSDSD